MLNPSAKSIWPLPAAWAPLSWVLAVLRKEKYPHQSKLLLLPSEGPCIWGEGSICCRNEIHQPSSHTPMGQERQLSHCRRRQGASETISLPS